MSELEQLREQYEDIYPSLDELRGTLVDWLQQAVKELGIRNARIAGRVKTPESFILKAMRKEAERRPWDDPLAQSSDKVGVRADLVFLQDLEKLQNHIESSTDSFEKSVVVDDKLEFLGADRLGYHGVHIDVTPTKLPEGLDRNLARCEIQLRTNAQASWAMAVHDLVYKAPVAPPQGLQRKVNRLTALLELFDETVYHARNYIMGDAGYPLAIVIDALEAVRMRYLASPYDKELTRTIVSALIDDIDANQAHDIADRVNRFRAEHNEKLSELVSYHSHYPLLSQPESLLVFLMLESDRINLKARWIDTGLPYQFLDDLSVRWGRRLPPPE